VHLTELFLEQRDVLVFGLQLRLEVDVDTDLVFQLKLNLFEQLVLFTSRLCHRQLLLIDKRGESSFLLWQ